MNFVRDPNSPMYVSYAYHNAFITTFESIATICRHSSRVPGLNPSHRYFGLPAESTPNLHFIPLPLDELGVDGCDGQRTHGRPDIAVHAARWLCHLVLRYSFDP